jgi:hypothetical protein
MSNQPKQSAESVTGDSDTFIKFMRKLVQVPHSEIKAAMEAEKRTPKAVVFRAFRASRAAAKNR